MSAEMGYNQSCRYYRSGNRCVQNSSSTSVFYFISSVGALIVIGLVLLLFFCCLYYKTRRIRTQITGASMNHLEPHMGQTDGGRPDGEHAAGAPPEFAGAVAASANTEGKDLSYSCVIMAGEHQPTFLAHPLSASGSRDAINSNSDQKLDNLEQGLNSKTGD